MIITGKNGNTKEVKQIVAELRGRTGAETAKDRPLSTLEKLFLMAEEIKEAPPPDLPSREGFLWRRRYSTENGSIVWEETPDPDYAPSQSGSYIDPVAYVQGMTVEAGKWYTDGADIWEAVKSGSPSGFDDTEYFDIVQE